MTSTERSKFFQVRISDDELRMLNALAEADGLSASDVVRQMIRRRFIERWNPEALEAARKPGGLAKKRSKAKR